MQALLYADIGKKTVSDRPGGGGFSWPKLVQGDDVRIGLRFTQRLDDQTVEVNRTVQSMRASLSRDDARPEAGTFKLKFGEAAASAGVNLTASIDFDATAEEWATAINALSGLGAANPVTVTVQDGSIYITAADGSELTITLGSGALFPRSFLRVRKDIVVGAWVHECRLVQSALAFTDVFAPVVPLPPTLVRVREGGSNGDAEWDEVQSLTVPPAFRGTYQISRGFEKTILLSTEDGLEEITEALKLIADEDGVFVVTDVANSFHIKFTGSMGGASQDLLAITVFDAPPGDPTFTLSLSRRELDIFLNRKQTTPEKVILEVEAVLENEHDDEVTEPITLIRAEVEVVRENNWPGLSEAQDINWNRPPFPRDYVPFVADQVAVGVRHYGPVLRGNGSATVFVIDHDLASELVLPLIRENVSDGALLRMGTDYSVEINDNNSITVTLLGTYASTPPATNALAIGVIAFGQASQFESHTHTIAQVVDLQDIIDDLGGRVETLETAAGLAGSISSPETSAGIVAQWTLPTFVSLLSLRDPLTTPGGGSAAASLSGIPAEVIAKARRSGLLPAVHDATAEALPDPLPTDAEDIADMEGKVYQNQTGGEVVLPGGMGRRSVKLKDDEYAAVLIESNGRVSWYRVAKVHPDSTEKSWYPTDYEHELFFLAVNDAQLRTKKMLEVKFGLEVGVFGVNTKCQWCVIIEHGTWSQETSPATTGVNLKAITWNATPVLKQPLIITPVLHVAPLGCRIIRSASETFLAKKIAYGEVSAGGSAPASANFLLRARLACFDTEDGEPDPRGFVGVAGCNATFGEEEEDSLGKAVIKSA